MTAYMIVILDCTDPAWVAEYRANVPALIERAGGRYLSLSRAPALLEGDGPVPQTVAIVSYPSAEAARAFFASEEYRPYAEARQRGAVTTVYLVNGETIAG
jgi:uncharacterized protein (DUF1330 family)